jgi:hypothetical protein
VFGCGLFVKIVRFFPPKLFGIGQAKTPAS